MRIRLARKVYGSQRAWVRSGHRLRSLNSAAKRLFGGSPQVILFSGKPPVFIGIDPAMGAAEFIEFTRDQLARYSVRGRFEI